MNSKRVLAACETRRILDAALGAAERSGLPMTIAVVDEGGYLLCAERMDGAGLMTPKVAIEKARTAALMRAPSRRLADRVESEPALLRLTDYLPMAGGLPILVDGQCVGAIGVSGGTADQDEAVCTAGLTELAGASS